MFSHFKKHYSFDSSKTCINAYLAKNTEPSKIKDMSASKIILFSSIFIILIILILTASLKKPNKKQNSNIMENITLFIFLLTSNRDFYKPTLNSIYVFT